MTLQIHPNLDPHKKLCGERGIRTPDDQKAILVFKTSSFSHSDTSPSCCFEARAGIEPAHSCFADSCVSTSPTRLRIYIFYLTLVLLTIEVIYLQDAFNGIILIQFALQALKLYEI